MNTTTIQGHVSPSRNNLFNKTVLLSMTAILVVVGFFVFNKTTVSADDTAATDPITVSDPVIVTVADVSTVDQLNTALADTNIVTINIAAGEYDLLSKLNIVKAVSINGVGIVTIKADNVSWSTDNSMKHLLGIYAGTASNPVTISNIIFDSNKQAFGLNTYNNAYGVLNNVTIENSVGSGLTVNGSTIIATGLKANGNTWGSVDVDPGSGVILPSAFTLNSGELGGRAIWSDGNHVTSTATVTVNAPGYIKSTGSLNSCSWSKDTIAPVITLTGTNPATVAQGSTYIDEGATAADNLDGVVTVISSGTVNINLVGVYTITYTATDVAGNSSTATRTVNVTDQTAPVITVTGTNPASVTQGSTYTDEGATATDNVDTAVTVITSGSVDTNTVGTYTITYTATDVAGNSSIATRTVNVSAVVHGGGGGGGGGYITPTVTPSSTTTTIPGCGARTSGFSTTSGQSCVTNSSTDSTTSNTGQCTSPISLYTNLVFKYFKPKNFLTQIG